MTVRDAWTSRSGSAGQGGVRSGSRFNMWKVIALALGAGITVYALLPSHPANGGTAPQAPDPALPPAPPAQPASISDRSAA